MASQNPAETAGCLRRLSVGVRSCPGSPAAGGQYGKIQSGTYTVPSGGNGEIIFDPPFSAAPQLALTSVGSATDIATAFKIKNISATKAEILVMYVTNSGVEVANSQSDLHWIACEV